MRALRIHATRDVRVEEVSAPHEPGPGEVLVAPALGGICGTDVQLYQGWRGERDQPQILCHEFAGEVVAIGSGVERVVVGDRVAVVPIVACGRCATCRAGRGELCPGHQTVGLSHAWGGFGELALLGVDQLAVLPDTVSWEQAALIEPLAVAATGLERAGVGPGDRVLIVGGGPIGALAALLAEAAGAADVLVSEPRAPRARRLAQIGIESVNPLEVDVAAMCHERSDGVGFDAAIDYAGTAPAFTTAIAAVRLMGRVAITAIHHAPVELDPREVLRRSLTIAGAYAYPVWSWPRRIAQIASGRLPIERVVTGCVGLDGGPGAFEALVDPDGDDLKLLIEVRRSA